MKNHTYKKKIERTISNLENLIEELIKIENELIESEERFRMVADYSYDWEYWIDARGNFIYTSPSVEIVTEYTPDDFAQHSDLFKTIIYPEDWDKWKSHRHNMMSNGQIEPIEFRIRTKSGDMRWIHHVCRTVYDRNGKNCGIRGSNRDLTKQKLLQEEIESLRSIVPICARCKKIRNDKGYWEQVEEYIEKHSKVQFSHGICESCADEMYGAQEWYQKTK